MRTVIKIIIATVLLSVLLAPFGNAEARLKYYRYNDNIPMVEMTLNMMVAMGVLEPIPSRLVYDGNPYNRLASDRYDRYSRSPYYSRAGHSSRYRYYGDYWDEPIRPYGGYSRNRYDYLSDPWDRYSRRTYRDAPYSRWDSPWADRWNSPWDAVGYGSWNNPWGYPWYTGGLSPWGSSWLNPLSSPYGYIGGWPLTQGYPTLPVLPESLLGDDYPVSKPQQPEAPSQQNNSGYTPQKTSWPARHGYQARPSSAGQRARPLRVGYQRNSSRSGYAGTYQQLNGLWIDDKGEMLGIRGDRFLWNDNNRYAKGQLIKSPTVMEARIRESRTVVRFQYRLKGDELVILSRDGKTRSFHRIPMGESHLGAARPRATDRGFRPANAYLHLGQAYKPAAANPALVNPRAYESPGHSSGGNTLTGAVAAYKPGLSQSPVFRAVRIAYPLNDTPVNSQAAPMSTDIGRIGIMRTPETPEDVAEEADISRAASAEKASQPARGNDDEDRQEGDSDAAAALSTDADVNDPYTYLYSYLKDPALGNGSDTIADNSGSNIWRPNDRYPHRRRDSIDAKP